MEAIEDMQRLGTFLADHVQVGLPHVGADELDLGRELFSDDGEETLEGFQGAFFADPEQAGDPLIDLVDQGQVFMAFGILDFIHPDGADRPQGTIRRFPARRAYAPSGPETACRLGSTGACHRTREPPRRVRHNCGTRRAAYGTAGKPESPTAE